MTCPDCEVLRQALYDVKDEADEMPPPDHTGATIQAKLERIWEIAVEALEPTRAGELAARVPEGSAPLFRWRGGGLVHIGPPDGLGIAPWSPLWSTRCGLERDPGRWSPYVVGTLVEELIVCPDCLRQAGL